MSYYLLIICVGIVRGVLVKSGFIVNLLKASFFISYAKEAADFSTNYKMPKLEFARNHYGQSDVAMFDFTSIYAAENASYVLDRNGHKLLMGLVGDSLLEPFWPTGELVRDVKL